MTAAPTWTSLGSPGCLCAPRFQCRLARGSPRRLGSHLFLAMCCRPGCYPRLRLAFRFGASLLTLCLGCLILCSASQSSAPTLVPSETRCPSFSRSCFTPTLRLCDHFRLSLLCCILGFCQGGSCRGLASSCRSSRRLRRAICYQITASSAQRTTRKQSSASSTTRWWYIAASSTCPKVCHCRRGSYMVIY